MEERTYQLARRVRAWIKRIPRKLETVDDSRQVIRSSGSVAANYVEANEALSKKDFLMRIKICRKEAKESRLWLRLLDSGEGAGMDAERLSLINESVELMKIFGAILRKSEGGGAN